MDVEKVTDAFGKLVAIYFDDGQKITRHAGILKDIQFDLILIMTKDRLSNNKDELIPRGRIIRIELLKEDELEEIS